jgi:alpha-amylase/alpha-mannosidase (GH57 family)
MTPLRFFFGLHIHQPVGNFGNVFADHTRDVYRPIITKLAEREFFPIVLHMSGPLLEWLEQNDRALLDQLGALARDGRLEFLLSGFYEPVLASLPRRDRVEQIEWMRDALKSRFGAKATGLWLTERVWEPDLTADLAQAGVQYALVDDRHFLVSGFKREQLHAPHRTESDGRTIDILSIDERLRYLIPFRPAAEIAQYLKDLRAAGHRLAVFADDGEKFGGWPGTREWVYERGWLDQFLTAMETLVTDGEMVLTTGADALKEVPPTGIAYLPTASYREMEAWSLPADAAIRLESLEKELGEERLAGPDGALIRGAHWRNFFVKYSESNRAHKKMLALSSLSRERGDPADARRSIGRAQCNDAYWHGVFGGLYLPWLREAIWKNLARAERVLRQDEELAAEVIDIDCDGSPEIWVHSSHFSAIVSPRRGGAVEELTLFESEVNYGNSLTRRWEAYHELALQQGRTEHAAREASSADGAPSIHDLEGALALTERPPVDLDDRAILVDRILPASVSYERYARADYTPVRSWARSPMKHEITVSSESVEITLRGAGMIKRLRFSSEGALTCDYEWDTAGLTRGERFAPEISLYCPLAIISADGTTRWAYPIETVAKSERGFDRTVQGQSITPLVDALLGRTTVEVKRHQMVDVSDSARRRERRIV